MIMQFLWFDKTDAPADAIIYHHSETTFPAQGKLAMRIYLFC